MRFITAALAAALSSCVFEPQSFLNAADATTAPPERACQVLDDLTGHEGKVVAVVGRYSFRSSGRSVGEEKCAHGPGTIRVVFDRKNAPKIPEHLEIDAVEVKKLLQAIQQQTALGKFRFGSPDYDRWAVVYGRVEPGKSPTEPAQLVCAGDTEVMFIVDRY